MVHRTDPTRLLDGWLDVTGNPLMKTYLEAVTHAVKEWIEVGVVNRSVYDDHEWFGGFFVSALPVIS